MTDATESRVGIVRRVFGLLVLPILLVDSGVRALAAPVIRWITGLALIRRLSRFIQSLPPYAILCVLAVPFIGVEPLKIVALYWIAEGHFMRGAATLVAAYAVSFLLVDRIFEAGRDKLMRIGWFAQIVLWVAGWRDMILGWLRGTAAWRVARGWLAAARERLRRSIADIRARWFAARP